MVERDAKYMEPLPAHPNLEQQQKLAKRLLREVWGGDAAALARVRAFLPQVRDPDALRLHDAQLVIARGYGFDSWAGDEAQDRIAHPVAAGAVRCCRTRRRCGTGA